MTLEASWSIKCTVDLYNPLFHTLPLSQSGMRGPDQVRPDLNLPSHTFYVPSPPPFPLHHPAPGIHLLLPSQIRLPCLLSTPLCSKSLKVYLKTLHALLLKAGGGTSERDTGINPSFQPSNQTKCDQLFGLSNRINHNCPVGRHDYHFGSEW